MLSDAFLHPDHVVPAAELICTLSEDADGSKAEMRMIIRTVCREVLIRLDRIRNASVNFS